MSRKIEQQTAKVPSIGFLGLAVGSMVASAGIALFSERKELANFVGLWAPSLLLIGIYSKLVKLENQASGWRESSAHQGYPGEEISSQGYAGQGVSPQGMPEEGYSGA